MGKEKIFLPRPSDPRNPVLGATVEPGDKDCRDSAAKAVS